MNYKHDGLCGERLRKLRNEHNLSQSALVDKLLEISDGKCDIKTSTYSNMESNHSNFQYLPIYYLAQFYGVSTDYLLGLTDSPSPDYSVQAVCKTLGIKNIKAVSDMLEEDRLFALSYFDELLYNYPNFMHDLTIAIRLALKAGDPINLLYPSADLSEKEKQQEMLAAFLVTRQLERITEHILECMTKGGN